MPVVWKSTVRRDQLERQEVQSMPSEVLRETFAQAYEEMPLLPGGMISRYREQRRAEASPSKLTPEQAMERVKRNGLEGHLSFDRETTEEAVDLLSERKRKELYRQDIAARSPGGFGLTAQQFALSIGTSLADPVSAGLNFVPVVGQARYARWLAKAPGIIGRTGVRTGVGAVEGAVGAAIYEPLLYTAKQQEQADYDLTNSLLNVAFGTVTGGGIHVIGGASADAFRQIRGLQQPWEVQSPLRNAITAGQAAREAPPRTVSPEMIDRGGATLDNALNAALGAQAKPVTRVVPPILQTVDEAGVHTASVTADGVKIAEAKAQQSGEYLQMQRMDVNEEIRREGIAQEMVLSMAREAEAKGLTAASGSAVPEAMARVYEALERRGVPVERNPRAVKAETPGLDGKPVKSLVSSDGKPVFVMGKVPRIVWPRVAANAAEIVAQSDLRVHEPALRLATSQLAEDGRVDVAAMYPGSDRSVASPDPDLSPQKSTAADAEIREGDDTLEALEEAALLEEQLTAQQAKLMGVDSKAMLEASQNEAQRFEVWAQAAELAQVCLVRGG
jgi:predicted GNAT family acetyltransferase